MPSWQEYIKRAKMEDVFQAGTVFLVLPHIGTTAYSYVFTSLY